MNIKRPMHFFAADAVSAADSPTGASIEVTPRHQQPPPEIIQPEPEKPKPIRQAGVKTSKVDVAKELGLSEAPSDAINREAKRIRDEHGKFVKTPKGFGEEEPPPAPKLGEPTPEKTAKAKPAAPAEVKTDPAPPAKIKIGDQEKTAEEWAAWHKELEEKSKAKLPEEKPPESAEVKKPEKTPDELSAEQKQRRDQWFTETVKSYSPTEQDLDVILSGGKPAVAKLGELLASVAERERQWFSDSVQPFLDKLDGFDGRIAPVIEQTELATRYQAEHDFLTSNPDIKGHAEGMKTMREVAELLHAEHDGLAQTIAANRDPSNATLKRYLEWANERVKTLEENFIPELAKEVRYRLSLSAAAPAPKVDPPTPATAPAAVPPKARPTPPAGQLSSTPGPRKMADQASQVAELMRSPRW
jgi:hypothetical protein